MQSTLEGFNKRIYETQTDRDAATTERDNILIAAFSGAKTESKIQSAEHDDLQLNANNNPYVKSLQEMGIKINPENALAKAKKCEQQWFQLQRL